MADRWAKRKIDALLERYHAEMGHAPPEPRPNDPLSWQWDYSGSKAEREALEADLYRAEIAAEQDALWPV